MNANEHNHPGNDNTASTPMSTIIKATDRNRGVHGVPFNFDDVADQVTRQANEYLKKVRAEAAAILANARSRAEQEAGAIRRQAEAEGLGAAQRVVDDRVAADVGKQIQALMPALQEAIGQIRNSRQAWLAHWEKTAVHLAAAIAQRLIRRELEKRPELTLTLIREALELAAGSAEVRLHLNPADAEALAPHVGKLVKELSPVAPAQILPSPQITPGGCRVETRFGAIDQQWEAQLARIEEELT
jgi:flagellar biosynthesis/type III secretory pathway protein FliH